MKRMINEELIEDVAKMSESASSDGKGNVKVKKTLAVDEIDNSEGNAMLRYKKEESNKPIVVGSSEKPVVLMGNGDRPKYSKSGSDFVGEDIALKNETRIYYMVFEFSHTGTNAVDIKMVNMHKSQMESIQKSFIQWVKDISGQILSFDEAMQLIATQWKNLDSNYRTLFISLICNYILEGIVMLYGSMTGDNNEFGLITFSNGWFGRTASNAVAYARDPYSSTYEEINIIQELVKDDCTFSRCGYGILIP